MEKLHAELDNVHKQLEATHHTALTGAEIASVALRRQGEYKESRNFTLGWVQRYAYRAPSHCLLPPTVLRSAFCTVLSLVTSRYT